LSVSESRPQGRKRENTPETVIEELGIFLSIYLSIAWVYLGYISLLRTGRRGGREGEFGEIPQGKGGGGKTVGKNST
jgi:hypothetical protein